MREVISVVNYNLDDKVVIITGASTGLGEQFAHAFGASGANVVIAARRENRLQEICKEISSNYNVKCLAIKTDVKKEADIIKLIERTNKEFGTVDTLVNNVGMYVVKPLVEQTLEDWNLVINVNLTSAFLASREVARVMIPKNSGSIINIASTFGFGATEFTEVGYYASKGGMITLTKALAVELGKYNIRVNAIAPGFFPTDMSKGAMDEESIRKRIIEPRTALPMLAEKEWIRGAACFLASDDARYITGQILAVDGGWLAY